MPDLACGQTLDTDNQRRRALVHGWARGGWPRSMNIWAQIGLEAFRIVSPGSANVFYQPYTPIEYLP